MLDGVAVHEEFLPLAARLSSAAVFLSALGLQVDASGVHLGDREARNQRLRTACRALAPKIGDARAKPGRSRESRDRKLLGALMVGGGLCASLFVPAAASTVLVGAYCLFADGQHRHLEAQLLDELGELSADFQRL